MKIQIVSDLHIEFPVNQRCVEQDLKSVADILVIAGDLCPMTPGNDSLLKSFREKVCEQWKHILFVPGNHEFYGLKCTDDRMRNMDHHVCYGGGVFHSVNNHILDIDNIRFICTSLWSSIKQYPKVVASGLNDYFLIKGFTIDKCNELHQECRDFLENALKNIPENMKAVVVTHHGPSFNFVVAPYIGNCLNEAFFVELGSLLIDNADKVQAWVHGHSHNSFETTLGNTNSIVIRNPLGYVHMGESKNFKFLKTIDIG